MHTGMPLWYENHWQALLLVQALLGVFAAQAAILASIRDEPGFGCSTGGSGHPAVF